MTALRPKIKLPKCEVPPPAQRLCAIPDCGEPIGIDHVVCGAHWAKLPLPVRGICNRFRRRYAGDEYYDRFIAETMLPAYQNVVEGKQTIYGRFVDETPEGAA